MNNCKHEKFQCFCSVGRLTDGTNGPVTGYTLDVKVQCSDCNEFFEFIGVPAGYSPSEPTSSMDFTELRIPIRPNTGSIANKLKYVIQEEKTKKPIN